MARREALRLAVLAAAAGMSAALLPRLAWAAEEPEFMPHVRAMIEKWVGPGRFPGLVATLGLPGKEPEVVARGSEGFTDFDAMGSDTLFRIYSMTKPVTGMAAMILIDEGRLSLDQPLADILPRYARMTVQKVPDGPLDEVVPAKAAITIRHLLTHTSGLGYTIVQKGPIKAAMEARGLIAGRISRIPVPGLDRGEAVPSLALFADRLAEIPLVHQPGTTWSYNLGLDLLGRVIEVASGQPFDRFLQERIFDPCGMASTFFQVPAGEAHRLATNHAALGQVLAPIDRGEDSIYLHPPAFPFGGSGLVSSPRDYDRFLRMLAQEGAIGGSRVMSAAAVRLGTSDLLPEGIDTRGTYAMGGGFGAGGRVGRGAEAGLFGWAGAAGTVATVDMRRGLRSQFFAQFMPPDALPLLPEYQAALRDDVTDLINRGEKGA
ncbi:MAG: beta-lactamase family protein [Novosphingobium sp.]|nr:beta-lactamase family protein [Novosphingobium sp.]